MVTECGPRPVPEWLGLVSTDAATRDALAARLAAVRVLVIAGEGTPLGWQPSPVTPGSVMW